MKATLSRRLLAGFAAALALLVGVTWVDWRQTVRAQETREWADHTVRVLGQLSDLRDGLQEVETRVSDFVITADPSVRGSFNFALGKVDSQLKSLRQLTSDNPRQQSNCDALERLMARRIAAAERIMDLRQNSDFEGTRKELLNDTGKAVMNKIRVVLSRMNAEEQTLLEQRSTAAHTEVRNTALFAIAGGGLSIVLFITVFALVLRENRLRRLAQERMARTIKELADFKAALDAHAVVSITDPDGKITYVNDKFTITSKYSREELLGQQHRIINSGYHPKEFMRQLWETIGQGKIWKGEIRNRAKDGHLYWKATTIVPFLDPDGKPLQFVSLQTDITQLKEAEAAIQRLNAELGTHAAELEAGNKELEAFSYSVSHDLRAPLRAVDGFSHAVLEDYGSQLPAEGRQYLQTIRDGAQRMGILIDDLLTFSRLSRLPLNKQATSMTRLAREALEELNGQRDGRKIDIRIGDLPPCEGDQALLKQVWVNLLSNAVKYTRKREEAVVDVGARTENGENVYVVSDNGTGFDMQYADKLFGVFQRLHRAEEFEGTGVGLAIVQRVVHRHGGRVWAKAEIDRGASFCFTVGKETIT